GRNFSYLDTQLKRLGSTNFTQIPVNAPRCPVAHFQRDGHMQMSTQPGRATYEPNSFSGTDGGPREDPAGGFPAYPEPVSGEHRQIRAESFADHYSQARLFLISQTEVEREHMRDAFAFELGKCEIPAIRTRMLANLRNVDEEFAAEVADALGMPLPDASDAAVATRTDLPAADELSILKNAKGTFTGRKLGLLVTEGADADVVNALRQAVEKAKATVQIIGPVVGPLTLSDGSEVTPDHALAAAPSVLFDAVAVITSDEGATFLADQPGARDFVSDAFTHFKFIGYSPEAASLLDAAGVAPDQACTELIASSVRRFVGGLGALRQWDRDVSA
ncbi:MAG: catalase-related domain-containing protein, partial [Actinomycetia bacterium]|nr:catalase-related domain-containing protein [Actinomycetes bacterium]